MVSAPASSDSWAASSAASSAEPATSWASAVGTAWPSPAGSTRAGSGASAPVSAASWAASSAASSAEPAICSASSPGTACCGVSSSAIRPRSRRVGLLRHVGVLGPGVDLELRELLTGQAVAGHHAFHGQPDDLLGPARLHLLERARAQPAGVAGVAVVALVLALVAAHVDLLGVDDDDEVARVDVRRVLGLALAAQQVGELRREAAERLAVGVDDQPVPLAVGRLRYVGSRRGCHCVKKATRRSWIGPRGEATQ